jgi:hypothetical protein
MKMKKPLVVLIAVLMAFAVAASPALLEARGFGGGGHGGGFHGGFGGHPGGFHGGFHGRPFHHGAFFAAPFLGFGAGFLAGYWLNGFYYTYPYNGTCQRWVPTGSYHLENRQDPYTGSWVSVEVPDGYWEGVPCY